jgi:hypothetical protein
VASRIGSAARTVAFQPDDAEQVTAIVVRTQ